MAVSSFYAIINGNAIKCSSISSLGLGQTSAQCRVWHTIPLYMPCFVMWSPAITLP